MKSFDESSLVWYNIKKETKKEPIKKHKAKRRKKKTSNTRFEDKLRKV